MTAKSAPSARGSAVQSRALVRLRARPETPARPNLSSQPASHEPSCWPLLPGRCPQECGHRPAITPSLQGSAGGREHPLTLGDYRRPPVVRRTCARLTLLDGYTHETMTDLDRHWLERLQVMGKAQSRYLWILLITMIFYGALQERVYVDTDPLKIPIVDVEISGSFVLGFGPALISFFVLAITGTMRRPARRGRSSTLDAVTGAEKNSTPRPMHSTWPSTLPGSPQSLSRLLPTSATLHSWLSVSTRPRG